MEEASPEAQGSAAFVAMGHLLSWLEQRGPGTRSAVITAAVEDITNAAGPNAAAIVANLVKL